ASVVRERHGCTVRSPYQAQAHGRGSGSPLKPQQQPATRAQRRADNGHGTRHEGRRAERERFGQRLQRLGLQRERHAALRVRRV
ncbi:MAG: hypothetical protein AVDCRST_MAG25-1964, partial [uncultured Rubrobacteraceae bacterium]